MGALKFCSASDGTVRPMPTKRTTTMRHSCVSLVFLLLLSRSSTGFVVTSHTVARPTKLLLSPDDIVSSSTTLLADWSTLYQSLPDAEQTLLNLLPLWALGSAIGHQLSHPPSNYRANHHPYPRGHYDPEQARRYYARHPLLVAQRVAELWRLGNRWLLGFLADRFVFRCEAANRRLRAAQLLELITQLGPTAIKVGQALSVRDDLLPIEYTSALQSLQDQVPPFLSSAAKHSLHEQLGAERVARLRGVGADLTRTGPVASASIGQVYKARLDNVDVAVKVQRPNVLAEIALDIYLCRELAPVYQWLSRSSTNLQELANEWGRGFIAELDYRDEAAATMRFNAEMQRRNIHAVCAPKVIQDYVTEQVLVTEWVEGTRLDLSSSDDIPRLCSVALNAYLVMLLELQSLHCDPHPGNLLRTTDGRLCILDFGMTLSIDNDLQYSLLEFVAHLTSDNYDQLPEDLVQLGFLKADKLEFAKRSGILEPFKYFLQQAGHGGGAAGVRERVYAEYREKYVGYSEEELLQAMREEMQQTLLDVVERESIATGITVKVEELHCQNRDSFRIPEWFLYTSRAFLTLEGVTLQSDPSYSLIKSCFPYIAKRLVGDDDPRARKALKDLLYGASDMVDVDRLLDMANGFSSYTTTTKTMNQKGVRPAPPVVVTQGGLEHVVSREEERKKRMEEAEAAITLAKDSADILLAKEGNLVQSLLVEESALAASAEFKDALRKTFVEGPQKFRDSLPLGAGIFLPKLPFEHQVAPFVQKTKQEVKAQELAEKLAKLSPHSSLEGVLGNSTVAFAEVVNNLRALDPDQAALVVKELRENIPKYAPLMGQLGGKFASTLLRTASYNIETTLAALEAAGQKPDHVTRATVKGLANVAQRGATVLRTNDDASSKKM